MEKLNDIQLKGIEMNLLKNGRALEKAKWNYMFNDGSKDAIETELVQFQNADGGFGNGLEADILLPASSSIASTEAIFIAYDYELNCETLWFKNLLYYLERSIQKTPSFWEKVPKEVEDFPHAPWWNYNGDTQFTPNPCAVIASAFIKYGSETQKALGYQIAAKCIEYLNSNDPCQDHDFYCLQRLVEVLQEVNSPLINEVVLRSIERRMLGCLCTDESQWMKYVAQPLDLVTSPQSQEFHLVAPFVEKNFAFWSNTLREDGFWNPNFTWGIDSEIAQVVTKIWTCYIAVKRVKIFKAFGRISA